MCDEFKLVNEELKKYFGSDLVSLVIFGSSCRQKNISHTSDLDYCIILNREAKNAAKISRILKQRLKKYVALLAFNIYGKNTFLAWRDNNPWLILSIKLGYFSVFDKNNFFQDNLEDSYRKIVARRIAPLGWKFKKAPQIPQLYNHLIALSADYLESSMILNRSGISNIAVLLLCQSMHCLMSSALYNRNIFITRGEISQCFFKGFNSINKKYFRDHLLELEQVCGQLDKMSFDFNLNGSMSYLDNSKHLAMFYWEKRKVFEKLKKTIGKDGIL